MEHEHNQLIADSPDAVSAVLGDVSRLPEFVPRMRGATGHGSRLTPFLAAGRAAAPAAAARGGAPAAATPGGAPDSEVTGTLDGIRRLVESKV